MGVEGKVLYYFANVIKYWRVEDWGVYLFSKYLLEVNCILGIFLVLVYLGKKRGKVGEKRKNYRNYGIFLEVLGLIV